MAERFFTAVCDKCGAKYKLPAALSGQMAQCGSCGKSFQLPVPGESELFTENGEETLDATPTVKMKKPEKDGMIPVIQDKYQFGIVEQPTAIVEEKPKKWWQFWK